MATRNSATDNSNINPVFSKTSVMKDFGMTGNKPKPKPSPSPTWTRQQLDAWIGDTVAEGDFSTYASRVSAVSAVAKKALATGVVSNAAAARRTAQYLLKDELKNGPLKNKTKGMK